jgi:CheY-like chemotaxis protein
MNIFATDQFLPFASERRWRMEKKQSAHSLKILLVEDNKSDAMLIQEMLSEATRDSVYHAQYELIRKEFLRNAIDYLVENKVDVILLDLSLPDSKGQDTVRKMLETEKNTPVIVLTGLDDETITMQALQNGVQDYINKNQVDSILLVRSIKYAIERFNNVREKVRLIKELKVALENVKTLSGLLPICANCKDIRTDDGYWIQVESYLKSHSDLNFTHSICPDCLKKLYPDFYNKKRCSEGG